MSVLHEPFGMKEEPQVSWVQEGAFPLPKVGDPGNALHELQGRATFLDLIKACAKNKDLHKGSRVHADILKRGLLAKDIGLSNALLNMYAKCGAFAKAHEMLDEFPRRSVVTWNALISAYAQQGLGDKALSSFEKMQDEGFLPNAVTFVCVLKACGSMGAAEKGEEIHAEVSRQGLLALDMMLGTALIDMYAKCGVLAKAEEVFYELPKRDVASWTALIAGYVQHGSNDQALSCFKRMQKEGVCPNAVTFICLIKACGNAGAVEKGEEIYEEVKRQRLLANDIILGTALVDMYAKFGALAKARNLFDELPVKDVPLWSVLIAGYAQNGQGGEAINCFRQMQIKGLSPNAFTYMWLLKACGSIGAVDKGEEIHAEVKRKGLLQKDIMLGTALLDMYRNCGDLVKSQEVFDELPAQDVASWTALIAGYAQHDCGSEALRCFEQMKKKGFSPNAATFTCILKACGSIGAAEKGEEVHVEVGRQGLLGKDVVLGTALVDMYAKSGALAKAQEMFDELPTQNLASWNVLIAGYAQVGNIKAVLGSFGKMVRQNVEPNLFTFVILLTAFSHAGLIEEGQVYFDIMSDFYSIIPSLEHRTCMVDMFSRAGRFDKAVYMIEKVSASDCLPLWSALLGACQIWGNMEIGRWAFDHTVKLDENFAAAYVCMSSIYAAAGMQDEVYEAEALRI
ncbi:hypothetical protein GOP47_0023302 [Adiantum capillus-veneris]|uniref:Pentatricopeptide repeat-containing protein n=1 Tax=Adiantum capillus-veneris TaxID=13818 RepID=A0A9D4U850_ADICA|nr:hypothetical protein GOP47_0023302 [Adiantum capillus-veneris]